MRRGRGQLFFFEDDGTGGTVYDPAYPPDAYLVFGRETKGLPPEVLQGMEDRCFRLPMRSRHNPVAEPRQRGDGGDLPGDARIPLLTGGRRGAGLLGLSAGGCRHASHHSRQHGPDRHHHLRDHARPNAPTCWTKLQAAYAEFISRQPGFMARACM